MTNLFCHFTNHIRFLKCSCDVLSMCLSLYDQWLFYFELFNFRVKILLKAGECNSTTFQTLSGVLKRITLLIPEFYCSRFTDLIVKISRFVLYYLMGIIMFQFKYEIVGILIDYLKLYSDAKTWDWCLFTKLLLLCRIILC